MRPTISYIVPAFKCVSTLEKCLESIPKNREIIVVGRGDVFGIRFILEKYPTVIFSETKVVGAAHARNQGASIASGDYLAFLDADTQLSKKYVEPENLMEFDLYIYSVEYKILTDNFLSRYLQARKKLTNKIHFASAMRGYFLYLDSAFMVVEKNLFDSIGGFREELLRFEDRDLGYRLQLGGAKICLAKEMKVFKLIDESAQQLIWKKIKDIYYQSKTIFTTYPAHLAYIPESRPFHIFLDERRMILHLGAKNKWIPSLYVLVELSLCTILKIFFINFGKVTGPQFSNSLKRSCLITYGSMSIFRSYQDNK